jgi:hypothetical protein
LRHDGSPLSYPVHAVLYGRSDGGKTMFSRVIGRSMFGIYWFKSNIWCPRLTAAMMPSGLAVQVKGFGLALCSRTKRLMAA